MKNKKAFTLIELLVVVAIIAIFGAMVLGLAGCGVFSRSTGKRVGTVTKFSYKGLMFKSYEGELVMGGLNAGGYGNVWSFSVQDPKVAEAIDQDMASNLPVVLTYEQTLGRNPFAQNTTYLVTGVTVAPKQ